MAAPVLAEDAKPTPGSEDAVTVKPGESPTESVGSQVPEMNQDKSNKALNAGEEHPPTNRVEEAVPPMKPGDKKASDGQSSTQTNTN